MTVTSTDFKELREAMGLTQEEFGNLIGVTVRSVRGWELGTNKPTGSRLKTVERLVNRRKGSK